MGLFGKLFGGGKETTRAFVGNDGMTLEDAKAAQEELRVGAAQFFKGEYEKAIFSYLAAREHGANASMVDDNLWEACEAMANAVREPERKREAYMRYKVHCPNGKYIKNLKKLYG